MRLLSLHLHNFRNFADYSVEFPPGITVITGLNGSGKSNLLEAIYLMASGRSFRGAANEQLVKSGEIHLSSLENLPAGEVGKKQETKQGSGEQSAGESAYPPMASVVESVVQTAAGGEARIAIALSKSAKRYFLNGKACALNNLQSQLAAVIFAPEHLNIIIDQPARRRQFLDEALSGMDADYEVTLGRYGQVLRQRNRLLATRAHSLDEMDFWDQELIANGAQILHRRQVQLARMNRLLADEALELDYLPSPRVLKRELGTEEWSVERITSLLREKIEQNRELERRLGFTLIGPQRDDFTVSGPVSKQVSADLALYGSRGQQRLAVVNLKAVQLEMLAQTRGEPPIFLLDDVFSELDETARRKLLPLLKKQQTLLTTIHPYADDWGFENVKLTDLTNSV